MFLSFLLIWVKWPTTTQLSIVKCQSIKIQGQELFFSTWVIILLSKFVSEANTYSLNLSRSFICPDQYSCILSINLLPSVGFSSVAKKSHTFLGIDLMQNHKSAFSSGICTIDPFSLWGEKKEEALQHCSCYYFFEPINSGVPQRFILGPLLILFTALVFCMLTQLCSMFWPCTLKLCYFSYVSICFW